MQLADTAISALANIITGNSKVSPYRSGPDLVDFFNQFGSDDMYGQGFPSRHTYTAAKLYEVNGTPTMIKVVEAAVDPRNFLNTEFNVEEIVETFNRFLIYDGYEIFKDGLYHRVRGVENFQRGTPVKNLIFAPIGPKPEIVLDNATTNDIKIVKNAEYCLVYDRGFSDDGLFWEELVDWWCELHGLQNLSRSEQRRNLYDRLKESLGDNEPEKLFFTTYYRIFFVRLGEKLPALVPQVYLHYDPYTTRELHGVKRLSRERMDFLLFLPHHKYVVMEIDGKQHYSQNNVAAPNLYAEMVAEDRKLKFKGYEIYRFGGYEFISRAKAEGLIQEFFETLFQLH